MRQTLHFIRDWDHLNVTSGRLLVVVDELDLHLGEVSDVLPDRVKVCLPVGQEGVELAPVRRIKRPMHR